jgi:hypothetical protein
MYSVLFGLMLNGARKEGIHAVVTQFTCPDDGWLTFEIEHHFWTHDLLEK